MKVLIAALFVLVVNNTWAAIGTVSDHTGTGCEITRGKDKLSGNKGAGIESMDIYTTKSCVTNITFRDDTRVKVNENSRLLIDDFVFDPKASDAGKLALKVAGGTVRYASGQIAKNNPQRVDIKTPTATIAVRGTDFNMTVDETGQSLIILVPSCKDPAEIKQYELDEQRCRVGKIDVSTLAGTVVLDQAFEATFVASQSMAPTPPVVVNMTEGNIGNNLIIIKPSEVQRAIKESSKSKKDRELEEMEAEASRRLQQIISESAATEPTVKIKETYADGKTGCNPRVSVCVAWEKSDVSDIQLRGKGTAYRTTENEHYAEVKTQGHASNTFVGITQNDVTASAVIGDGSPGGNLVNIKQNTGVLRLK